MRWSRRSAGAFLVAVGALAGCVHRTLPARPPALPAPVRLAVLPFRIAPSAPGTADDAVPAPADAGTHAARLLVDGLGAAGVSVVDAPALDAVPDPSALDASIRRRIADTSGANVVALGTLRRYVERVGSGLGVTSPASVAYDVALIATADGTLLGTDRFDYTQAPLNANLLDLPQFLEGGGRWRTRDEILERAVAESGRRIGHWLLGRTRPATP